MFSPLFSLGGRVCHLIGFGKVLIHWNVSLSWRTIMLTNHLAKPGQKQKTLSKTINYL